MAFPIRQHQPTVPGPVDSADVTMQRMYYTLCRLCGALDDWSDTSAVARRNRKTHLEWHNQQSTDQPE